MPDRLFSAFKNVYIFLWAIDFASSFPAYEKRELLFSFPSCRVTVELPLNTLFPERQRIF